MTIHRGLLAALLVTASSVHSFGQAAAPAAAPAPVPAGAAPVLAPIPFKNASFEEPAVEKRKTVKEKGNPARIEATDWGHFLQRKGKGEGALNIGLTNEIARTGKQSIYIDFAAIAGKGFTATLMTELVPVKPEAPYKIGMWGRMDKERPLTLDQRRPYLRMEFEFYQQDEETQVGETEFRAIRLPGSLKKLLLSSSKWNQVYGVVRVPKGAALMKVSYVFNVPNEPGKTDGTLFFDDGFMEELPADSPIEASDEIMVESGEEEEEAEAEPEAKGEAEAADKIR